MPRSLKPPRNTYAARAYHLKRIGYASYSAYLVSPLWKEIRIRVLTKANWKCFCCDNRASQVHHNAYDKGTLLGTTLRSLIAVCGKCHQTFEFSGPNGKKLSVAKAAKKAKRLRRKNLKHKLHLEQVEALARREADSSKFRKYQQVHFELDRKFDALCRN